MHEFAALNQVLIMLFFSVISVALFRRINLPSVLGYLLVGMLAGHHAFDLIPESTAIEQIAEIGVVFLLFTIGLEVSIPKLMSMKGIVFGIGSTQVLVSTLSMMILGLMLGYSWQISFAVGGALALSSTAIVVKQLTEQHELHSRHGHIALGVLLLQDLAVVPFLVLIPIFASPDGGGLLVPISLSLLKAGIAFAIIYLIGTYLLRPLMHWVSATYSSELFTLFILLVALLAAWLTWSLGLSLAMGAFLAGIMLAETEYQHQVQTEIRPFRDILMGLFFISVGSQFDWQIVLREPFEVIALTVGLLIGKSVAVALIARLFGYETGVSIRSGIALGQGSEFGFALLAIGISSGLLTLGISQPIAASIIFSMVISPMLLRHNGSIARRLSAEYRSHKAQAGAHIEQASHELNQHVIICGFGRTGQNLAQFLKQADIPFLALELDPELINENWDAGEPVYYGDSSHPEVLEHAGIGHARALIVTFHDYTISGHITRTARRIQPDIPIIVRTPDDIHMEDLLEKGASEVIPDTVESSIMLAWHTLNQLGMDREQVDEMVDQSRSRHYARVRAFFHSKKDFEHPEHAHAHHLHSIEILDSSPAVGRSLDRFKFYTRTHSAALVRNGIRAEEPLPEAELTAGDVLILEGSEAELRAAEIEICQGK
jgi:CPA2 family monovalent cation:H+ antiporter-2